MSENEPLDPLRKGLNNMLDSMRGLVENGLSAVNGAPVLPVDVFETETSVIVKAGPLPGVQPEDLDVSFTTDTLTIRGETKPDNSDGMVIKRERRFGPFSRTVKIPRPVKADEAVADFKGGMLTITLPKVEEAKPKVINVKSVDV
jgi:HSP20 family protein